LGGAGNSSVMATPLPIPAATDGLRPPVIGIINTETGERKSPTGLELPNAQSGGERSARSTHSSVQRRECAEKAKATRASFRAPAIWMLAFGVLLVICAGTVDVVAYEGLGHTFVSHVTGTTARVGMRIEGVSTGGSEPWDLLCSSMLVGSFIFGSFLCGLVIPKGQMHFGGKSFYGIALVLNAVLLAVAAFIAPRHPEHHDRLTDAETVISGCLAAMACGLQNAMCTMHFGAVVRTTHVTGTATDIGSTAGRAAMLLLRRGCRRKALTPLEQAEMEVDGKKLRVLLPLFFGFGLGCVLGAFLFNLLGVRALLVPAGVTGTSGSLYMLFRNRLKIKLKQLESSWLKIEVQQVEESLARAHSYLQRSEAGESSARHGSQGDLDLDDVDSQIGHALEFVHDVESTIMDLVRNSQSARSLDTAHGSHCKTPGGPPV